MRPRYRGLYARKVSSSLGFDRNRRVLNAAGKSRRFAHNFRRCAAGPQQCGDVLHGGGGVVKKAFVSTVEIVQPRFAIRRAEETVLGTLPVAEMAHLALAAVARQGVLLGLSKGALKFGGVHFAE